MITEAARPDFLIVGAQKSGTTTLFRDISQHPDVFTPAEKEPEILVKFDDAQAIESQYSELFGRAKPGQLKGEASTAYTKRPVNEGVAERALRMIGPDCRILYIERDPIERIVSHYLHFYEHGLMPEPFEIALEKRPELIDFSRYDYQIEPWISAFGPDRVLRLKLEDYKDRRALRLNDVFAFLGLDPALATDIDLTSKANTRGEAKAVRNPVVANLIASPFYQRAIKPLFPDSFRERARRAILPAPDLPDVVVTPQQRAFIEAELSRPMR